MMYELAGVVGVNAREFTYRALSLMGRQRRLEEWDRTAEVVAAILNKFASKRIDSKRLNPYRRAQEREHLPTVTAAELGEMFRGQVDG